MSRDMRTRHLWLDTYYKMASYLRVQFSYLYFSVYNYVHGGCRHKWIGANRCLLKSYRELSTSGVERKARMQERCGQRQGHGRRCGGPGDAISKGQVWQDVSSILDVEQ